MRHFNFCKLLKSHVMYTNVLCLFRFGSDQNKLAQLLIRAWNIFARTVRTLANNHNSSVKLSHFLADVRIRHTMCASVKCRSFPHQDPHFTTSNIRISTICILPMANGM